jgi:hypothetical protein
VILAARWGSRPHYTAGVGHRRFVVQVSAPREQVFDLWTNLDRAHEWIEGLTRITDVTGPVTTNRPNGPEAQSLILCRSVNRALSR